MITLDKNTKVGTVRIEQRKWPFKAVMYVSAEQFAEFGLENQEDYVAVKLVENNSTENYFHFVWEYLNF